MGSTPSSCTWEILRCFQPPLHVLVGDDSLNSPVLPSESFRSSSRQWLRNRTRQPLVKPSSNCVWRVVLLVDLMCFRMDRSGLVVLVSRSRIFFRREEVCLTHLSSKVTSACEFVLVLILVSSKMLQATLLACTLFTGTKHKLTVSRIVNSVTFQLKERILRWWRRLGPRVPTRLRNECFHV